MRLESKLLIWTESESTDAMRYAHTHGEKCESEPSGKHTELVYVRGSSNAAKIVKRRVAETILYLILDSLTRIHYTTLTGDPFFLDTRHDEDIIKTRSTGGSSFLYWNPRSTQSCRYCHGTCVDLLDIFFPACDQLFSLCWAVGRIHFVAPIETLFSSAKHTTRRRHNHNQEDTGIGFPVSEFSVLFGAASIAKDADVDLLGIRNSLPDINICCGTGRLPYIDLCLILHTSITHDLHCWSDNATTTSTVQPYNITSPKASTLHNEAQIKEKRVHFCLKVMETKRRTRMIIRSWVSIN